MSPNIMVYVPGLVKRTLPMIDLDAPGARSLAPILQRHGWSMVLLVEQLVLFVAN